MRLLDLNKAIAFELDHRAYWLRGIPSPLLLVAAAKDAGISLCRPSPEPGISRLCTPGKVAAASPHPTRPLLALMEHGSGKLFVQGFDGSLIFEEPAPRLPEGLPEWMTAEWMTADCQFDVGGAYLLCAATMSEDRIEVQLRETDRWSVVSRAVVEDPFGASSASFVSTARSDTWALWLGAGQDGQRIVWVTRDDSSLRTMIEPRLENRGPLAFSPGGGEFLTIGEPGSPLERYAHYQRAELLGVCESPDEAPFGPYFCYLDHAMALALAENGRMAVVDTRSMRVVEELAIEGHEPRPTEEYHPRLVGDGSLCTDISYMERVGDYLVVVHPLHQPSERGPDGKVKYEEWRDELLCFPISYILESVRDRIS